MSIFDELAAHAELEFADGRMLPLEAYRSDEVLAAERAAIFATAWTCVGRTADLVAPGDHLVAEVPSGAPTAPADGHRSVIVLRDERGRLVAHDNVCIHRGARLLESCVNVARITCPYHAWAFRLDGSLIGAPYMSEPGNEARALRPEQHRLGSIRLEEWEGFVFVSLDPDDAYVADLLALLHAVNAEDQPVIEAVRRNADGVQFERGPLSYLERNVFDFDQFVARAITSRPQASRPSR